MRCSLVRRLRTSTDDETKATGCATPHPCFTRDGSGAFVTAHPSIASRALIDRFDGVFGPRQQPYSRVQSSKAKPGTVGLPCPGQIVHSEHDTLIMALH